MPMNPPEMVPVVSFSIYAVGYDDRGLFVQSRLFGYRPGNVTLYRHAEREHFDILRRAVSPQRYFLKAIEGRFEGEPVD